MIYLGGLTFSFPFKATVTQHSAKTDRGASKAKSEVCCSNAYGCIRDVCKSCRNELLVIIFSSFLSMGIPESEKEGFSCGSNAEVGISSVSCRIGQNGK